MASVEACKDDEAFARSLQALYDEDEEGVAGESVGENGTTSDTEPDEYIPQECWPKNKRKRNVSTAKTSVTKTTTSVNTVENKVNTVEDNIVKSSDSVDHTISTAPIDDTLKTNKSRGKNVVLYTEEEERLFLEGLNMYGREWCKVAKHVGTRDRASITSHAQKYFIHLWIRGIELPPSVAKSGHGYSLSGKPLDPDSSSLRPYLKAYINRVKRGEHLPEPQVEASLERSKYWSSIKQSNTFTPPTTHSTEPVLSPKIAERVLSPKILPNMGPDGKTDYSRNRPKRGAIVKGIKRQYLERGYELMKCSIFSPKQPFSLKVYRIAISTIDLHSHILDTEIVGVLAGTFNSETNQCIIQSAIPCDRKETDSDSKISVEATEESLAEASCLAQNLGLSIMGWYHSHPIFSTDPSYIDVKTQHEHQVAFNGYIPLTSFQEAPSKNDKEEILKGDKEEVMREDKEEIFSVNRARPFVGVICGPYSVKLPSNQSEFTWFIVGNPNRRQPYRLKADIVDGSIDPKRGIPKPAADSLVTIARLCKLSKYKSDSHDFSSIWRKGVTYKSKLLSSLSSWLKDDHHYQQPSDQDIATSNDSASSSDATNNDATSNDAAPCTDAASTKDTVSVDELLREISTELDS